jgi:hypothetical protein
MQVRDEVESTIVRERLLDWVIFSIDGCDAESYGRYRIRGKFDVAFANLVRFHRNAVGTGIRVLWQYVVFRWNDRDDQFRRAITLAEGMGIQICSHVGTFAPEPRRSAVPGALPQAFYGAPWRASAGRMVMYGRTRGDHAHIAELFECEQPGT